MLALTNTRLAQVARGLQVQGAAHLRHRQRHLLQPVCECARRALAAFAVSGQADHLHRGHRSQVNSSQALHTRVAKGTIGVPVSMTVTDM